MRYLLLSSCFLLLFGCGTSPYLFLEQNNAQPVCFNKLVPAFKTELYNAQINVTGKHLSGLLLFKTMQDSSIRVVFTSETGLTFFDFEFSENDFEVINCISKLNKKPVIKQLKNDIGLLLRHEMKDKPSLTMSGNNELYFGYKKSKETIWYITDNDCMYIKRIETASQKKKKVIVNLTSFGTTLPDSAYLEHQLFEFNISLQKIDR